ncbi:hypothetical protein [Methylomagnum sp.]
MAVFQWRQRNNIPPRDVIPYGIAIISGFKKSLVPLALCLAVTGCIELGPGYARPEVSAAANWLDVGDERLKPKAGERRE